MIEQFSIQADMDLFIFLIKNHAAENRAIYTNTYEYLTFRKPLAVKEKYYHVYYFQHTRQEKKP